MLRLTWIELSELVRVARFLSAGAQWLLLFASVSPHTWALSGARPAITVRKCLLHACWHPSELREGDICDILKSGYFIKTERWALAEMFELCSRLCANIILDVVHFLGYIWCVRRWRDGASPAFIVILANFCILATVRIESETFRILEQYAKL